MSQPLNPAELALALYCEGARIAADALADDAGIRTRAGLGSGLEAVIPGPEKNIWINIPIHEGFAAQSPFEIKSFGEDLRIVDTRNARQYPMRVVPRPSWYDHTTSRGTPMSRVGTLQGTYLGVYVGPKCGFWTMEPKQNCQYCTTGINVGSNEEEDKHIDDVVETALAAKQENRITFVHLNCGYQEGRGIETVVPYVLALKERVGCLVGVQMIPDHDLSKYDTLIDAGVDHFSFCYELHDPEHFAVRMPGKASLVGQQTYFDALEYASKKLGPGRCSGEIIAGIEPIEATLDAIDYITSVGAFPTVCVFRPLKGSDMEDTTPPKTEDMIHVFTHLAHACQKTGLPIGVAPNIEVSLVLLPTDALYLARPSVGLSLYKAKLTALRTLAKPYFKWRMRRHTAAAPPAAVH